MAKHLKSSKRCKSDSSSAGEESKLRHALRSVPWVTLGQIAVIVGRRWAALSTKERTRLTTLLRKSSGRLSNLSVKERLELRKLAHKLDARGMARELVALRRGHKRRGRRGGRGGRRRRSAG